jgi:hypothetical protein
MTWPLSLLRKGCTSRWALRRASGEYHGLLADCACCARALHDLCEQPTSYGCQKQAAQPTAALRMQGPILWACLESQAQALFMLHAASSVQLLLACRAQHVAPPESMCAPYT